jgi:DNA polymerase I-like protein with 3'-5' exonuclease and polymerase domains
MVLVSADAASCQDRMIVSRAKDAGISDDIFEDMILNGDKAKGTDSHTRARDEINKLFPALGRETIERDSAKNFSYGYKFGCGAKKIGFMAGEKNEARAVVIGKAVKAAFDTVFQAQIGLQAHIREEWVKTARRRTVKYTWNGRKQEKTEFYNGYIVALDGRRVLVRSEKDVLVYAVQSDEAIMMQVATVMANKELRSKYIDGVDYKQVCFYHDEYTFETKPEIAEDVKGILERCIAQAGEFFNLTIKQIGEGQIGLNWAEVH